MNFSFDFDMADLMALHKDNIDNGQQFKRVKVFTKLAMPLGATYVIFRDYLDGDLHVVTAVAMILLAVAGFLFLPKFVESRMLKSTQKSLEKGDYSGILGRQTIVMDEEGISHTQQESEARTAWSGIQRLHESESHYFLYNTDVSAIVIPKYKIEVDLAELDQMLKSNIG